MTGPLTKLSVAIEWLWGLFYLFFNTAHLIFAMKYLALSFTLNDILKCEDNSEKINKRMRLVFLSVECVIIIAPALQITNSYLYWVDGDYGAAGPVAFVGQLLEMVISILCLLILVNAVQRIKKLSVGDLAISNKQMKWHVLSFSMFAVANIVWLIIQTADYTQTKTRRKAGYTLSLTAELITIICVSLSELPLLHILHSIIAKGIKDQEEDEAM